MTSPGGSRRMVTLALVALVLGLVYCQSVEAPFEDEKVWHEADEPIDALPNNADRPQVAIDTTGNAIAVWDQTEAGGLTNNSDDVWSNERRVGGDWVGPHHLAGIDLPLEDSLAAQIGVGGDGSAVVVFLQSDVDGGDFDVWAIRRVSGVGWDEDPVRIGEGPFDASRPQIAVDQSGNAVAVWQQVADVNGEVISIWSNRYLSETSTWHEPQELESGAEILIAPQVGMDADGNAIVVWEGVEDEVSSIWSRRVKSDGSVQSLLNVEAFEGNAFAPQVAVDPQGDAIAVWAQQTDNGSTRLEIRASRYIAAIGDWNTEAESVGPQGVGDAQAPQIGMDDEGNAIAVWAQVGSDSTVVWSNRFVAGVGWSGPVPIGPTSLSSARAPQLAVGPNGDAVAVWVQFDGVQDSVWSNRYVNQTWQKFQPIETENESRAFGPQVATDAEGNAVAVWVFEDADGGLGIWSSHLENSLE